jgi:DNA-binding CsgD family transcriptional regulator
MTQETVPDFPENGAAPLDAHTRLGTRELLRERVKELSCVYEISRVAASELEEREALQRIARALALALRDSKLGRCRIKTADIDVAFGPPPLEGIQEATLPALRAERQDLLIILAYAEPTTDAFLPEERSLLESMADICEGILSKARFVRELREAGERLTSKNIALRELLDLIEEERRATARSIEENARRTALPLVEKLRDGSLSDETRKTYADALAAELKRLSRPSSFEAHGPDQSDSLSPREREVIRLLRAGKTSKEIAVALGLSSATVERHRHNIRRKLGLVGRDANLQGLLMGDGSV